MDAANIENQYTANAQAMIQALDNTGVRMFMYFPQEQMITVPEKTCAAYQCSPVYNNMPQSFADDFVHPEDHEVFCELYYRIARGEKTADAVFHSKDLNYCHHVTLTTISWTDDGQPNEVFGIIENLSEAYKSKRLVQVLQNRISSENQDDVDIQEAVSLIADIISDSYLIIYHIWMEDYTYICFREVGSVESDRRGKRVPCDQDLLWRYSHKCVESEYVESVSAFFSLDTLQQRLSETEQITCIYKRLEHGWTKGQFIVAKRDLAGNATNVIFAVSDINAEVEREEKKKQAIFEAQHDPLTGVYNRKGYELYKNSRELEDTRIGLAIIDIDNFKPLNDNHGHEVGDHVLTAVSRQLKNAFRNEDKVFRLGGDEFAVLFMNCDESVWSTICQKLKNIHTALCEEFSKYADMAITLSVGLCFSDKGFDERLSVRADKALYETKQSGRAGCTLIDLDQNILKQWHDDSLSIRSQSIMEYNNTGICRIEIPLKSNGKNRLVCGEATKVLLGVECDATPEACYQAWWNGIEPSYIETLQEVKKTMLHVGPSECTYLWNHPKWGKIFVRSGGFGSIKDNVIILQGYHHTLKDTKIIEKRNDNKSVQYDDNKKSLEALFNKVPSGIAMYEWDGQKLVPLYISDYFEKKFTNIHPDDVAGLQEAFQKAMRETHVLQHEYRVWNKKEKRYSWLRIDAISDLQSDGNLLVYAVYTDITSHVVAMRDYKERLRSLLAAKDNALSMCIINLTQNTFEMVNSEGVMQQFVDENASLEDVMMSAVDAIVDPEDQKAYKKMMSREYLLQQAEKGNMHVQLEYLIRLEKQHYEWITAVVDMIQNPINGEISGVAFSKSSQKTHMAHMLLEKALEQDYLFSAVIFKDTDEFYLYNAVRKKFSDRMQNFWEVALNVQETDCTPETMENLKQVITKENVLSILDQQQMYHYAFNSNYIYGDNRLEITFSYVDDRHNAILATIRDITDSLLLDKLRHDSEHDPLTDLFNRKTVFVKCREMLEAYPEEQFVIVHVDIKHFRMYNTFFGDQAGDELLCDIANLFRWMDKDYEHWVYGRIEADVFCACFPYEQEKYQKHIDFALNRLKSYREDFLLEPVIGLYPITDSTMTIESMFVRATIAAKYVQSGKKDATAFYNDTMEMQLKEEQQVVNEMQTAIDQEQFQVHLQPKYSLNTDKIAGAEALVRWQHPKKGLIMPGKFIPIFERNGFIAELDRYMWEKVCQIIRRWIDEGKKVQPISVNVSRISMFSPATVHFLKELLQKYNIAPKYLELELTESAYIDEPEEMKEQMHALREAGFKILMDDFGSGYSSLNTLRELPVDILKLDMRFLSNSNNDTRGNIVVSSVIRMSKLLNLPVIAEGVENTSQAEFLRGMGCEFVQGYLYARPMPVFEFEKLL